MRLSTASGSGFCRCPFCPAKSGPATARCAGSSLFWLNATDKSDNIAAAKGVFEMEFHSILIQTRKAQGLSQEQLAAQVGVSRQAVSKWETGDAQPDLAKLMAVSEALHVSLDTLCGREVPEKEEGAAEVKEPSKKPWGSRLAAGVLVVLLLCASFFAGTRYGVSTEPTAPSAPALPDTLTVSGVNFAIGYKGLTYQFVPSAAGEGYTYQITFTGHESAPQTFDAPYSGGICTDSIYLKEYGSYSVTVVVSSGADSRPVPIAYNLNFDRGSGSASWNPVE
ncbi:hypothetical protein SDC9_77391 [bioreactor metagenome]|uniref:HTH cro/C1-type domain-containing protein n=1 Tax=bioreactor metagenome TaxID=1076179 RepID=A0A644YSK3_9ZZZZ